MGTRYGSAHSRGTHSGFGGDVGHHHRHGWRQPHLRGAAAVELHDFFFSSRRRHTRWHCDWSSDVCSSDLAQHLPIGAANTVDDVEVVELEGGNGCGAHRSSTCEMPSAMRLIAITSEAIASAGNSTVHQYVPAGSSV